MENYNDYLGKEKILKILIKFSLPCITGLLISALYNIVDQIFIGNSELGFYGNATTGISFPIICIVNAFAWCIGDGAASYLSICAGRKDTESAHKRVGSGITTTIFIGIVLTIISVIFSDKLMVLFESSIHTHEMANNYFTIVASFFVFYILIAVMNSIIRADGSPKYAMIASLIRDIVCFTPLVLVLSRILEENKEGEGIKGILYAAPIADFISIFVILILTIVFFKGFNNQKIKE